MEGRMFSNLGGGMLGLELPLHPPQTTQNPPQNPQHHHQKHPQMVPFALQQQQQDQQTQLTMKLPNYPPQYGNQNTNPPPKAKTQMTQLTNSDEDEPGCTNDDSSYDGKRKTSPWQRMKWTDNMVKLLIMAVYYIGDEGGSELGSDKKKPGNCGSGGGGGGSSGLLQKKGKWKSVSRAMMEKGFYVSPQQCEDKFNDLNKRYKRVNDILGKGTACKVVENQSLLESMDLTPKMKEEVKKLLNSKHLFFREMCAYHNSCGHGTVGIATESSHQPQQQQQNQQQQQQQHQQQQQQQQLCLHSATSAPMPPMTQSSVVPNNNSKFDDHEHDEEDEDEDEEDEDENEYDDEDDEHEEGRARKRAKTTGAISSNTSQAFQQLNGEAMGMLQDGHKSSWEKKQWVMTQLIKLEEQGVKFQCKALELEKQRLKWIKFSSKKEREMERKKIDNERSRLENERMMLLLKQKEIELLVVEQQQQQQQQRRGSSVTG